VVDSFLTRPSEVAEAATVQVLNGTTVSGLAGRVSGELERQDFTLIAPGNAPATDYPKTIVYDLTGKPRTSRRIAQLLNAELGQGAPEGVRIVNDPGQAVATVAPPMAEEVAAAAAPTAAAVTEPEVLTERKPKEGEEAAADDGKKPSRPARAEKSDKDK